MRTTTFPTPGVAFDRYDESQFRSQLDRQLQDVDRAIGTLEDGTAPAMLRLDVVNVTGSTIVADKIVAVTGYDVTTAKPKIVLADADVAAHEDLWITTASILNNGEGSVYMAALSAASLDTSGATTAGDPVYLSTTAGGFAHTAPSTAISRVHPVGFVKVKDATVGQIQWQIGPARKLGTNELQAKTVVVSKSNVFFSTEQTGTGASQNVAHGLGATPAGVIVWPTELSAGLLGGYDVAEGTHDGTNVVLTVTSGEKFKVFAWA